jgi:two-component system sensor histidine kinase PilS (NtrC family)
MEEHLLRTERMAHAGKMASEIAHEIRNPLAAISGAAQMLQHEMAQEPFHGRLMSIISREVRRIDDLISDFLWMARGPQKPESVTQVSVSAAIEDVFSQLKAKDIMNDGHKVEKVFEIMPTFLMEPLRLRQVLFQILANALQAMPDGGILTVRVAGSKAKDHEEGETLIEITDTGIGIAEENRARIFEPFFTSKNSGTGLGLSIAYQLMESLGGRIEANSDGQSGTSVSLFFPVTPPFPLAK